MAFKLKKGTKRFALWLLVIGGLNLGVMAFGFNTIVWFGNLFGAMSMWIINIVYIAIGVSALVVGLDMMKNK